MRGPCPQDGGASSSVFANGEMLGGQAPVSASIHTRLSGRRLRMSSSSFS